MASVFGVGAPEAIVVGVVALVVFGPKGLADVSHKCLQALLCSLLGPALFCTRHDQPSLLQAAKSLGKSLRGFAPTIRELAGVSNELKQTLEQEIGLDEIRREWRDGSYPPYRQDPATSTNRLDSNAQATSSQFSDKAEASDSQLNKAQPSDAQPSKAEASGSDSKQLKEISEDLAKEVDPSIEAKRAESARLAWGDSPKTSNVSQPAHQSQQLDHVPKADPAAAPKPAEPSFEGMTVEQLEAELARRRAKERSHSSHK